MARHLLGCILIALSLCGCTNSADRSSIVGIWRPSADSPPLEGHPTNVQDARLEFSMDGSLNASALPGVFVGDHSLRQVTARGSWTVGTDYPNTIVTELLIDGRWLRGDLTVEKRRGDIGLSANWLDEYEETPWVLEKIAEPKRDAANAFPYLR